MTTLASTPLTRRHSAPVESLRGLAALGVLVAHCWGLGHGYGPATLGTRVGRLGLLGGEGLALFFALSGYLLTRQLVRADRGPLSRYFRHRVARILPTWWFVLAVMLLVHDDGVPVSAWWRFPLLLQGFWPDTVIRVDGPAWSLAVEAQFYLLLPLLAWVLRRGAREAGVAVLVLAGVGTALAVATVTSPSGSAVWKYSLPANLVYFVPGIALAVAQEHGAFNRLRGRAGGHLRLLLLAASLPFWFSFVLWPRTAALSAVASGLTVAAVALPLGDGRVVRVLSHRFLVAAGTLSFGIYLWHEPLTHLVHGHLVTGWLPLLAVVLPASVLLATLSYLLVEAPSLRLRDVPWPVRGGLPAREVRLLLTGAGIAAAAVALAGLA
ncbi:MAG: acyltransferase [Streptomyces sp.]|uniref:acyltransferase family protein n=1 Tax=Streptomyces sp. TaxID=1931 RepID=UPI0025F7C224|nr:acyltransferase [Streptomyces sp.]MBW8801354.1 acyltransferase [Streptomyces sp.]